MNSINKNGTEYITDLIAKAVAGGNRTVTVTGNYQIEREIRLPSNFTLILDDCHLTLADGVYSNIFVNENCDTEIGRTQEGADRNIKLIGKGKAILDGGNYNGLCEKNAGKDGRPPMWKNNTLLFGNVDGFEVRGIEFHNQRWWALNFIHCRNGVIADIVSKACDLAIDTETGNFYHGLLRGKYKEVYVYNADCVDIRCGCHDILIENISGFTEDDTVALTALPGRMEKAFALHGASDDIYNITVKNVRSGAYCTNVRLLNQGGPKLHDILIDGVYDTSAECPHLDRGIYAVRIGDTRLYGDTQPTEDDTYNITVKNVRGRGDYAVCLAGMMKNVTLENIEAFDEAKLILDCRRECKKQVIC